MAAPRGSAGHGGVAVAGGRPAVAPPQLLSGLAPLNTALSLSWTAEANSSKPVAAAAPERPPPAPLQQPSNYFIAVPSPGGHGMMNGNGGAGSRTLELPMDDDEKELMASDTEVELDPDDMPATIDFSGWSASFVNAVGTDD